MKYYDIMKRAYDNEGLSFNEEIYDKFMKYMSLIKEWNEKINLTAITEEEDMVKKHFIDCIKCFKFKNMASMKKIIDVGTGAGFPGIPVKLTDDNKNITLLDSLNKRVNFLNEVIKELNLENINAVHSRAEDLARKAEHREKYDGALSRAVANMSVLSELCLPFVRVGGYFIAMKGPAIESEIYESKNAINILGGKIEEIIPVEIEDTDLQHNIVIIKKIKSCPGIYPRKAGLISKNPIA